MRRFAPALRRISDELKLPEPTRSRILLEMAADLEALYEHYRAAGVEEAEALRRTEEKLLASPEALQDLILVHTTGYPRWLSYASGLLRSGFELLLVALGMFPMMLLAALAVIARGRGMSPPFVLWPLLGIGAVIAAITLWKVYQLLVRPVRPTAELHRGLFTLLFFGGISPLLTGIAFLVGLYTAAIGFMGDGMSRPTQLAAAERMVQDATLLSAGLLLGIGAALVWFVLVRRIAALEQAESAALLAMEA